MEKSNNSAEVRTRALLDLMARYEVNSVQVGRILRRSAQTVRSWRTAHDRAITTNLLKLLEHELLAGNRGGSKRSVEADE